MIPFTADSPAIDRVRSLLACHSGPWPAGSNGLSIRPYRVAYLSTMFRVDGADQPYLVILKHQ